MAQGAAGGSDFVTHAAAHAAASRQGGSQSQLPQHASAPLRSTSPHGLAAQLAAPNANPSVPMVGLTPLTISPGGVAAALPGQPRSAAAAGSAVRASTTAQPQVQQR